MHEIIHKFILDLISKSHFGLIAKRIIRNKKKKNNKSKGKKNLKIIKKRSFSMAQEWPENN